MGKKQDRCTGHCCREFTLPLSPEELWASYARWRSGGGVQLAMSGAEGERLYVDIYLIAPMVIYKGYHNRNPKRVNPSDQALLGRSETRVHHYTCKHFNPKTKNCTIYDFRPWMCRDYPGKRGCEYAACTWKSRKAKRQIRKELEERLERLRSSEVCKKG